MSSKFNDLLDFKKAIEQLSDDHIWEPFANNQKLVKEFDELLKLILESANWQKERNHEKGSILEKFVRFLFERFVILEKIHRNARTTDNEIDVNVDFVERASTEFIQRQKCRFICECKNVKSKSIDVGQVTKLVEICKHNESNLGIFISIRGLGGKNDRWRYAEGKRRKLWLSEKVAIISFTVDELVHLKEPGINLYSEIIKKFRRLIDDIEDDSPELEKRSKSPELVEHLYQTIDILNSFGLIDNEEVVRILDRIKNKYGNKK